LYLLLVLLSELIDDFTADAFVLRHSLELLFQSLDLRHQAAALALPLIAGVAENLFKGLLLFPCFFQLRLSIASCAAGRLPHFDFFLSFDEGLLELSGMIVQLTPFGVPSSW